MKRWLVVCMWWAAAWSAAGQTFSAATRIIETQYYDTTFNGRSWDSLVEATAQLRLSGKLSKTQAIAALAAGIGDPALRYLAADDFRYLMTEATAEAHTGVGLPELMGFDLDPATARPTVIAPVPQSPADRAGIRPNDVLVAINGTPTERLAVHEVARLMRVPAGEQVRLLLARGNRQWETTLVSQKVKVSLYPYYRIIDTPNGLVGVIWIPQFSAGTAFRVVEILREWEDKGVAGIVLDLRNSQGGLQQEGRNVLGLFLGERPIAHVQSITLAIQMTTSVGQQQSTLPVAVLTNEGTAGTSELVAGALQHYRRATLFGTPTNRKGVVLSFFPFEDGSALVVPVSRVTMLNGDDVQTKGIVPDVPIATKQAFDLHNNYRKDPVLRKVLDQFPTRGLP